MSLKLWKCMFSFCVKNPKDIWTAYKQFNYHLIYHCIKVTLQSNRIHTLIESADYIKIGE